MKKYIPKKATVTATTTVVEITSAREGQFTCFISTRTSCRKLRSRRGYVASLPTGSSSANPLTLSFASSRFVLAACAIDLTAFAPSNLFHPPASASCKRAGRGGGIRTPTLGFGDRWSTVEPTPLNLDPQVKFTLRPPPGRSVKCCYLTS